MDIEITIESMNYQNLFKTISLAFKGWGFTWNGVLKNTQGEWWLAAQLIIISCHLLPPWPKGIFNNLDWPKSLVYLGIGLILLGFLLIWQAFLSLGASLSPLPSPKPGAAFIKENAYKDCRHPLYKALIIFSLGITIFYASL